MALTRGNATIQWSAASSITLADNNRHDSDAYTFDATDIAAAIQVSADNQGVAASGDTVDVYVKWTMDGTTYDTDEHAQPLFRLDTYATNTPGEDPAVKTIDVPVAAKGFKLSVVGAAAATRNVVVSALIAYQRFA